MSPALLETSSAAGGSGMIMMVVYMAIIFGVMYFLAIRPQKKEQKRMAALLATMEVGDTVVGCYHLVKGMEFDAVIAVWPDCELTDDERRRLYTACSRALHAAALLGTEKLIGELGIVL